MFMEKQLIKTSFNEPDGRHLLKNHSRMQRKGKQVNTGVAFTGAKLLQFVVLQSKTTNC